MPIGTYNPANHRWSGTLDFDLGRMNKIKVTSDGVITLEGIPVNPADHPVTITPGVNYIAFPFNTSMTLNEAFSGIAVQGDRVKSKTATSIFNRGSWSNQIPELEPGKGYIYVGVSGQQERVLVYFTAPGLSCST